MIGAFFILDDPIFNGLAISLIFGILVSTVLTLVVIPVLYYAGHPGRQLRSTPCTWCARSAARSTACPRNAWAIIRSAVAAAPS
jgi:predicted RND superfamily exporter protein